LRTPLNAVIGFAQTIKNEMFGPIGRQQYREYAGDIEAAGQHLLSLINDILDLSRIEAGKVQLREQECAVSEIVSSAVSLCRERAAESAANVTVDLPEPGLIVRGDEQRLKQVLVNLLDNALKFTAAQGLVVVSARYLPGGGAAIEVKDTGIGMSEQEIEVALKRFGQVDQGTNRKFGGTGLGLPLAQALTALHDGKLAIISTPRVGTTVQILLPASRVVERAARAPALLSA